MHIVVRLLLQCPWKNAVTANTARTIVATDMRIEAEQAVLGLRYDALGDPPSLAVTDETITIEPPLS